MNIILADDERLALKHLEQTVGKLYPDATLSCFTSPTQVLEYAKEHQVDIAFLDIEMGSMSGLLLAKQLKDCYGKTNIIFATGHSQYALSAYSLSPSGYLLKPISPEAIVKEVDNLRYPVQASAKPVTVQTFGNFEIFVEGKPLAIARTKSREILAYLVDRRGASCARKELAAALWPQQPYSRSLQTHLQILIGELMRTLKDAGVGHILIRQHGLYSVDTTQFICDYYNFIKSDPTAVNAYYGEYMAGYAWATFTEELLSGKR